MEVMKSALLTADWQFQRSIEKESSELADIGKVRRLLGLRCLQCVMRGLQVVVIVVIWKHIVRIGYKKTKTEVKPGVEKRMNQKRYLCPLPITVIAYTTLKQIQCKPVTWV